MSELAERVTPRRWAHELALRGDAWGVGAILLTVLALFAPVWLTGRVWIDGDLGDFYWPTMLTAFAALRRGEWPLWTPNMFGGFPLYADGSLGTLFPLNWVLLLSPATMMLIPFGRTLLAGLGMYTFLRLMRFGPLGATVGGLVFALNGFSVSHFSHIDLNNGTAMLPYTLIAAEKSLSAVGWRHKGRWLLAAGVAHALAWVSLHPMAPLMILPVYAAWVVYRGLQGYGGGKGWRLGGLPWTLAALTLPIILALGLAAAQVVPMYELGDLSPRQTAGARFNASFSLPPHNLIGLVWPTFFHSSPGGPQWGLWNLETLVYLGTLPFVLALVAVVTRPAGRHVLFMVILAVLALWTAFAIYAPLSPQPWLYSLPGYNVLRTPARFFYLAGFAGAYLAAVGADWLVAEARTIQPQRRLTWLLRGLVGLAILIPILAGVTLVFISVVPRQAERAIWFFYLNLPHGTPLRYEDVVFALRQKLNPLNLEMWKSVGLLGLSIGLLWTWLRGWLTPRMFSLLIVLIVAVDLTYLANQYVTPVPLEQELSPAPAADFIQSDRRSRVASSLNGDRYFHTKPADPPMPNLPFDIPDFNGQSSLNMARPAAYIAAALRSETRLLDLASVRYIFAPNRLPDTRRRYGGVAFDREQPLVVIETQTPDELRILRLAGAEARELRLMLALSQAVDVPQGVTVAEVRVSGPNWASQTFPIRAGLEAAEWAYDRPDVRALVKHDKPTPALSWNVRDETGQAFDRHLFYLELPLADGAGPLPVVDQIEIRLVRPGAQVRLFGASLIGAVTPAVYDLTRYSLARYQLAYNDAEARVYTSATTRPRAFLVGQAVRYDARWQALERLEAGLDITRQMTLENEPPVEARPLVTPGPADPRLPLPPAPDATSLGRVALVEDTPTRVGLSVEATAPAFLVLSDTYYPGWQATIDGVATPVLLANYNFRAVFVPPGAHRVTFSFEPTSVRLGFAISLVTWALVIVAGLMLWRRN